jgi:hypothetical protein
VTERSGDTIGTVTEQQSPEERRALFRVVRGGPSDAELAAVAVVLAAAASSSGAEPAAAAPDLWSAPVNAHRTQLTPGPGAWRSTYWPR